MKVILSQFVQLERVLEGATTLTKIFESNIVPHKGDLIEDSLWAPTDYQEVQTVTINYEDDCCYVFLPTIVLVHKKTKDLIDHIKIAKLHNWESSKKIDERTV